MYKYAVIFLICFNISVGDPSCCEDQVQTKSYLKAAMTMISKAMLSVHNCTKIKDRDISVDCADLYERGYNKSGVYTIQPDSIFSGNKTLDVYCDMDTDGGGWTVIQRRGDFGNPDDYFYRDWQSYKTGFGTIDKEFWLGNDNIFALSNHKVYSIRFDLQDKNGRKGYANYESFLIDDEYNDYTLHISGYSGNAGDGMSYHDNGKFSTKDKQNDKSSTGPCAIEREGAWWYYNCYFSHLNGLYGSETDKGIWWNVWHPRKRLTSTEMKIRPKIFALKHLTNNVKRESVGKS